MATGLFQAAIGLGQMLTSKPKKKEKALEQYAEGYQPSGSLMDYLNKSYAQFDPNAYRSAAYQEQQNQIQRGLATGIGAAQDRRGGLATIGALTQGAADQSRRAVSMAEQQQRADLSQYANAAARKAAEDRYKYELKYNLLAAKAGAAAKQRQQGLANVFKGAETFKKSAREDAMKIFDYATGGLTSLTGSKEKKEENLPDITNQKGF